MNLEHLRYAVEIEKSGSITQAAKSLYMAQPNLSKAVKELEHEIGITIFKRTPRGVMATEHGARFLSYAKSILSQMDELESLYKPQTQEPFRFSVSVPRATYITIGFTDFLCTVPPEIAAEISFKETSAMGAVTDIANGASQFAIVRVPCQHAEYYDSLFHSMKLQADLMWEFRMSLLMSETHPLASCNEIPYHMLDGYLEICHGDVQTPPLSFAQIERGAKLQGQKRQVHIYERGSQFNLLQRVPGTYMWVSPIPLSILIENHLVLKECPLSTMRTKDYIVFASDRVLSETEHAFIAAVQKYTQNELQ